MPSTHTHETSRTVLPRAHTYTQLNHQLGGVGLELTITRYTEDCKERARCMNVIPLVRKQRELMNLAIYFSSTTT